MSQAETSGGGASELRRSLVEATQRIDEIIDAAEKVAEEIRSEAQREAVQYLERRRREADQVLDELLVEVAHLPDSLQAWALRVGEQTQRVTAEVEGAVARLRELGARVAGPPEPAASPSHRPAPKPTPAPPPSEAPAPVTPLPPPAEAATPTATPFSTPSPPGPAPVGERGNGPVGGAATPPSEEALLRATQMAVAGSDRVEIERALRVEFSIADPGPMIDEILGTTAS